MSSDNISASDVYNAINGLRGEVREDQTKIWEEIKESKNCQGQIKLRAEKQNGRIYGLENSMGEIKNQNSAIAKEVVKTKNLLQGHINTPKIHWSKKLAEEGITAKLWRKKLEIAILTVLVSAVLTIGPAVITAIATAIGG